jgi:signal transduction histidine kinase
MADHDDTISADREWLVNQIAHALRNPIFAATVQAEALQLRAGDPAAVIKTADNLHGQLLRLSAGIDEMLLYGRPVRLSFAEVDVAEIVESLASRYAIGDRVDPASVTTNAVDPMLSGWWDRNAVIVILERLLDNAVQHTPEPHEISLTAAATGGDNVAFTVSDRGDGIEPEILEQALLPFYPQHRGRPGLGLAVADKFADCLGGRIELESTPGEGTTAQCVLPLRAG